jgi:PDZ domain-containing secreted protein
MVKLFVFGILIVGDYMKKILWLLILFLPFWVFAYSEYIIPGGETIGINIDSEGIVVMGFYKIDGNYINQSLEIGDRIVSVNGNVVNSVSELTKVLESNVDKITFGKVLSDLMTTWIRLGR